MKFNSLFTVSDLRQGEADPGGWGVRVQPSKRLLNLNPDTAIVELQTCVDTLKGLLGHYHQVFTEEDLKNPEHLEEVRKAAFQLDVSESYLAHLRKQHKTIH